MRISSLLFSFFLLTSTVAHACSFGCSTQTKHSLNLLFGGSKTKLDVQTDAQNRLIKVKTLHEEDAGLHFERRFNKSFKMGILGTKQENLYLTIGLEW